MTQAAMPDFSLSVDEAFEVPAAEETEERSSFNRDNLPSDYLQKVREAFSSSGPLAQATPGFVSRTGQTEFACAVAQTIENNSTLVAEAGTGTGKTFAYLMPALMAGCKVIVSTAGKSLQEQLRRKDIPSLMEACALPAKVAVLKGRSNYLCLHRIENTQKEGALPTQQSVEDFKRIRIFSQQTLTGDRSEISGVAEDSPVWPFVTSTANNCIGNKCQYSSECFVNRARSRAQKASVVVVNHHLFLSSAAMELESESTDESLIPKADVIIFDEAHKLPEIATDYFGQELSTADVREILHEMRPLLLSKFKTLAPRGMNWDDLIKRVSQPVYDFVLALDDAGIGEGDSKSLKDVGELGEAANLFKDAADALENLISCCAGFTSMNADLEAYVGTARSILEAMRAWTEWLGQGSRDEVMTEPSVRWISRTRNEARLVVTPLDISERFAAVMNLRAESSFIFTSATIATDGGDFSHFTKSLGIEGALTKRWESPFDHGEQAIFYVPPSMPEPRGTDRDTYIDALIRESWPVIDTVEGRTFVLCTSYRAMERAAEQLRDYIAENGRDYTVLVQREEEREKLIEKFRKTEHPILVATMSFWEGIDIKGSQLSLVIIDKLPFPNQDDPVFSARCDWIDQNGGRSFSSLSVPLAAISLKQGTGRLIRSETDRGVLILGDVRVLPRGRNSYGGRFIKSLPPYTMTTKLDRVIRFWTHPEDWE